MPTTPVLGLLVRHCRHRKSLRTPNEQDRGTAPRDAFSLYYFTQGGCRIQAMNRTYTLNRGQVFLREPGAPFRLQGIPGQPLSMFVLFFTPVTLSGIPVSRRALGLPPVSRIRDSRQMNRLFHQLADIFADREQIRGRFRAEECSVLGLQILLLLEPAVQPTADALPDLRPAGKRIWDVLDYINTHFKERLSVATLAKQAVLYPVYFSRVFKRITGLSPHRYVLEKKVEKAKDFLLLHNVSPASTAVDLGFHDYAHFYKTFRRITGKSPAEYKRKMCPQ